MQVTTGFGPERERFEKEQVKFKLVFNQNHRLLLLHCKLF